MTKILAALGLAAALSAALALAPSTAWAYEGDPWDDMPNNAFDQCMNNASSNASAQVCAEVTVDYRYNAGGVEHYRERFVVTDMKADNKCAHGVWQRTYQDGSVETHYGMYICGYAQWISYSFENYSTWGHGYVVGERIGAFVDGGSTWWAQLYPY